MLPDEIMPKFASSATLKGVLSQSPSPTVGDWELRSLPKDASLDAVPILIYEEMKNGTPEHISNSLDQTGFADVRRIPFVARFHLVYTAEDHVIRVKCLRKVC